MKERFQIFKGMERLKVKRHERPSNVTTLEQFSSLQRLQST